MDIALNLMAFIAVALAVRGKTWNENASSWSRRITATGWIALVVGITTFSLTVAKSLGEYRSAIERKQESARQVLADLAPQATFYRILVRTPNLQIQEMKDEARQFADYLEAKLDRHGSNLPVETTTAAERALGEQRKLVAMLERWDTGMFTTEDARNQATECFESAKALGDSLLQVLGNDAGMDGTYILSVEKNN